MLFKLPPDIASPQDLTSVIRDIQRYSSWYEHESIKRRVRAKTTTEPPDISPSAIAIIKAWNETNPISIKSLTELANTLTAYAKQSTVMTITLAAAAPQTVRVELVAWCRKNIDETILVNFRVNSTILGGMVVRYGSRIYDWSFRRKIMARAHTLPEILSRV